jgi:negative regulator of sigma E activity
MTDQIREQLSALLDGELPRDELGLLVRRLERDAGLRRAFGTYALIGETLRAPGGQIASQSFAARVNATIDAGPGTTRVAAAERGARPFPAAGKSSFWKRPMVRTALAASAAATAVILFRPEAEPVARSQPVPLDAYATTASPTPAHSQRLASYLVAHSQYSTPMVRRNVLSSLLAADPGIARVAYEPVQAP